MAWSVTFYSDRLEADILGMARVFYCTVVDRRIVFLHQFVKKSDRTPPKELEVARRRMKEFK